MVEIEGVPFDGKAPVDGADAVGLAEVRLGLGLTETFDPPDQALDLADPAEDEGRDGEGRIHGVIVSRDTIVRQGVGQCDLGQKSSFLELKTVVKNGP